MRHISPRTAFFLILVSLPLIIAVLSPGPKLPSGTQYIQQAHVEYEPVSEISGVIGDGETFFDIFNRYGLSLIELFEISEASAATHNISRLYKGRPYTLKLCEEGKVEFLSYQPDDESKVNVIRTEAGYLSGLVPVEYETRTAIVNGVIIDNLFFAMDNDLLALELSDIFAWDIDFTTDLRRGDSFSLVVEERWLNGKFFKYGPIQAAEFINNNRTHRGFRFDNNGDRGYYAPDGTSLRKSLLKAPLSYRRISSGFSHRRYHPILKKYRPHLGVDYSAALGTPVSSVGDGTVKFAARKGPNGKLVIIKHAGGYTTYYGHLHRIRKGIRKGRRVKQGQVIGTVGKTGRATGPHLDYRVKRNGRFVNPLRLKLPKGPSVDKAFMVAFMNRVEEMSPMLDTLAIQNAPSQDYEALSTQSRQAVR